MGVMLVCGITMGAPFGLAGSRGILGSMPACPMSEPIEFVMGPATRGKL